MTARPDLRQIAGDIRGALEEADRDTLLDVLTYVFEEYVIESPPPLRTPAAETLDDLASLEFAALVSALKARLDHRELELLRVDGDQVLVRAGGALVPLDPEAPGAASAPAPSSGSGSASDSDPETGSEPGSDSEAGSGLESGSASVPGSDSDSSPPRSRGEGRGGGQTAGSDPAPRPASRSAPADERGAPPDDGAGDDDASIRFSLLELD